MRGLLSLRNSSAGLLSSGGLPVNRSRALPADEADEYFLRLYASRGGDESVIPAELPRPAPTQRTARPEARAERAAVNPLRVALRTIFDGQDPFRALDAERERLEAEAQRPSLEARRAQLRAIAESMGPAAIIAYETNPEKFGENLAEQYSPQVIAAGGVQSVIGNGQTVAAPSFAEFGQDMVRRDPLTGAVETVATRGPTFAEETARINANNPVNVAPGGVLVDPRTGRQVAEGAPRVFSAADGSQLYDERGQRIAENVRDPAPVDPEAAAARQRAAEAERQQIAQVRDSIGRARQQIGFWTTGPLAGLSAVGGTPAADLAATLDTIEANLSFRALAEMRNNSPTGGALGSITERELQLLGSTVANLRQSQSPQQLRENLGIIERTLSEIEQRGQQGGQGIVSVTSPEQAAALPPGTRYRAPNGRVYIRE